jgi:hypothetical protein
MIAFLLLAPMVFVSTMMSMFAGTMGLLAAVVALVTGPLIGALMISGTALLGAMIFILS